MLLGVVFFWLDNSEHFAHRFGAEINDKDYLRQVVEILDRGMNLGGEVATDAPDEPSDEAGE